MPDSLKPFQIEILPSTLYAVAYKEFLGASTARTSASQLAANIQVAGHAGHVYGSQVLPDSPPAGMTKLFDSLINIAAFDFIPNYLYIDPVGADPTAIVLSSIAATEVS